MNVLTEIQKLNSRLDDLCNTYNHIGNELTEQQHSAAWSTKQKGKEEIEKTMRKSGVPASTGTCSQKPGPSKWPSFLAIILSLLALSAIPTAATGTHTTNSTYPTTDSHHQLFHEGKGATRHGPPTNFTAYDCERARNGFPVEIPEALNCAELDEGDDKTETWIVDVFIEKPQNQIGQAFRCSFITTTILTHMDFWGSTWIAGKTEQLTSTTTAQCWEWGRSRTWEGKVLEEVESGAFISQTKPKLEYVWYGYDKEATVTNAMLEVGTIAADGEGSAFSDFGPLGNTPIDRGSFTDKHHTVVWQTPQTDPGYCWYDKRGTFRAQKKGQTVVVDELRGAFKLTKEVQVDCLPRQQTYSTSGGVWISLKKRIHKRNRQRRSSDFEAKLAKRPSDFRLFALCRPVVCRFSFRTIMLCRRCPNILGSNQRPLDLFLRSVAHLSPTGSRSCC